jgi:predicted unusual protein kinase regulating ubiquinone biosynthesis (AarF/ABC1/UbiB family)
MALSLNPDHLVRYKDMAKLLIKYGRADLVKETGLDEAILSEDKDRSVTDDVEQLPKDLEALGPTYVKLGQFLSTRSDMLPDKYMEVLQKLQDKVEPFSINEVEKIIQSELGIRLSKAFAEFEREPIGAASIGQVHKAVLHDGRPVVVKVQRPGIREDMVKDLDALGDIADFLEKHTEMGRLFLVKATLEEFRKSTIRELNYKNEAQNLKIMAENLKEFDRIVVPLPVDDFTTSKVITMDYVKGYKVTSISPLRKMDIEGEELAEQLFRAYMKQIVIDGFYHCDPHPGNVFITSDNRIGLLDLGMVAYISAEMQRQLLKILLAIGDGRGDEVADYAIQVGTKNEQFDEKGFRADVNELVSRQSTMRADQLEIGRLVLEVTRLCGNNGIRVPDEFTMLGKTLLNLDKVGRALDPEFDPNASIRRNSNELLQKKVRQSFDSRKPYEMLLDAKEFIENLPGRVNKIFDMVSENKLKVNVDAFDEKYLMNGFQKIANRITVGLILAALIIGASNLMKVETDAKLFGYPLLAILFFLLAAIGGLALAFNIMFRDETTEKKEEEKNKVRE